MKKKISVFLLSILCLLGMASCKPTEEQPGPDVPVVTEYTVTFNSNGGSDVASMTVQQGGTATKPTNPTKDGYEFVDWFTDEACTKSYDFSTEVNANLTLYAKWNKVEATTYNVTFNTNGGSTITNVSVEEGNKVSKPTDPTKEGYVFSGWFTNEDLTAAYDFDGVVNANLTLYAKWTLEEVVNEVVSIEVTTQPTKLTYIEGEKFDPTGMVVTATYEDGTTAVITDYEYMDIELSLGLSLFPIFYGTLDEVYISVTVVEKQIVSVEIEALPTKVEYLSYESFDPTGLVLKVSFDNGKSASVNEGYTFSRDQLTDKPDYSVVVYEGIEVNVPITVTKVAAYGIPAETDPIYVDARAIWEQLEYTESAGNILGTTTFGDIQVVSSSSRYMMYEKVNTGVASHKYTYWDHEFEGLLKFGGASSPEGRYIIITPNEDGIIYLWASSTAGASLCIYEEYNETSTEEDIKAIYPLDSAGKIIEIKVYAGEKYVLTASANAFIRAMALVYNPTWYEVEEFKIDTTNVTLDFAVGQEFTSDGLASSVVLANEVTYDLTSKEFEVVVPDMTTAGTKVVKVVYDGILEKTYEITVHELTGVKVATLPEKNEYFTGDTLDLTGMVVEVYTANGISYTVTDYTVSKSGVLAEGDTVKVLWGSFECDLNIVVKANPIESISIKTMPTKTEYKNGESFDPTGLVLQMNYSDKSSTELDSLADVTFDVSVIAVDTTVVVATWDIFQVEIPITVNVVDYYQKDNTTYLGAKDILVANGVDISSAKVSGNLTLDLTIGDVYFNSTGKNFQYERLTTDYTYGDHVYTGAFKAGGVTSTDRYIMITPRSNGVLTLYATSSATNGAQNLYLVNTLDVTPNGSDATTYLAKYEFAGDGSYVEVVFNLEAGNTYYLWFEQQLYIRGMNLSYGKVDSEVSEMTLDTTNVTKEFSVDQEFNSDNLVVSLKCVNEQSYVLDATEYTVLAPDMSVAGTKTVTVKFGNVTVATYEIVVS